MPAPQAKGKWRILHGHAALDSTLRLI